MVHSPSFIVVAILAVIPILLLRCAESSTTHLKHHVSKVTTKSNSSNDSSIFDFDENTRETSKKKGKTSATTTARGYVAATTTTNTTTKTISASVRKSKEKDEFVKPVSLLDAEDETFWRSDLEKTSEESEGSISLSLMPIEPKIEMIVKPLSKVVLPCEFEGNYTSLIMSSVRNYRIKPASWLHEGIPVDMITIDTRTEMSGTGHRYIGDSTTASLHIDNVRLEDDGIWKCQIEDDEKKLIIGKPVKLVVVEPPRGTYLMIDGRRLDPGNSFIPVKEGLELTLECVVEGGNPAPILAWGMTLSQATLEGPEQLPDNLTILPSESPVRTKATLKVLRGHHNATIICVARHITLAVPINASILLDVQYTPSFAITRIPGFGIPIVDGMSVSLKCDVDSNPSSAPIWQRGDGAPPIEQSDDGWLNFTRITRADSGWYKCYTRHMLGIYTSIGYFLNVHYDPEIEIEAKALNRETIDTRKMEVQIGGAVTLECDGGCWGHGPNMSPAGGPGSLTLSKIIYQDAGEYRCIAPDQSQKGIWKAQLPYFVKVTGRPMIHPPTQMMTTKEGDSLDIKVEFCAEPAYTKVLWISEERVYSPGGESKDGVRALPIEDGGTIACYRSILRFERVRHSHGGEWLLLVRSPEGIADVSVALNITHAAGYSHAYAGTPHPNKKLLSLILLLIFKTIWC